MPGVVKTNTLDRDRSLEKAKQKRRNPSHTWTEDEIEYLKSEFLTATWSEMQDRLKMSVIKIRAQANKMSLFRGNQKVKITGIGLTNIRLINFLLKDRNITGCQVCGEHRWLDIHHIDGNHYNDDLENLAILCPNHHADLERPKWIWKECISCKNSFLVSESYIKAGTYCKYCSIECRRSRKIISCKQCGDDLSVSVNNKADLKVQYCGIKCRNAAMTDRRWNKCHQS